MTDSGLPKPSGEINYVPFKDTMEEPYIGQIILAKNLDEDKYKDQYVLCDGRELDIRQMMALYSLIENKFGDGLKFKAPDLSKVTSPVEGAKYYICFNGIYPSRD